MTISGKVTFDRVPFDTQAGQGLNPAGATEQPARGVVVEAVGAANDILASGLTDAAGDYSLVVANNTSVVIRAKAQMLKTSSGATWDVRILDNTNGDALYALDSSTFNTGTSNATRNLRAASGWGGTSYTGTRAAAPFAILDTMYRAQQLIVSAAASTAFPALNVYWSTMNKPTLNRLCIDEGDIGVTFYTTGSAENDDCSDPLAEGIYVLGDFTQGDTDEFDQHVLAHEYGHYVEVKFGRSDSIGGPHGEGDKLDLRVAFGEGWGNAFSGMVLNDPIYRDSFGGATNDFRIDMETDDTRFSDGGWYSETSVGEVLWDIFDSGSEPGDGVALGFTPIFTAMTQGQRTTDALTSIFSFLEAIKNAAPTAATAINQLRNAEQMSGNDAFGTGETNNGGDPSVIPVYSPIALNATQQVVCVRSQFGIYNGLGYSKFFKLELNANALVTASVIPSIDPNTPLSGPANNPIAILYRRGAVIASNPITQEPLVAGTYIIEIFDADLFVDSATRCMTFSVLGT